MSDSEPRLLLLIGDEPAQNRAITTLAGRQGWRALIVRDGEAGLALLGTRQGLSVNAVILDQRVPGDDACTLIAEIRARRPALPLVMLTPSASPLLAVEAMRAGATDYLIKPVVPDRLMHSLEAASLGDMPADELAPLTEKMQTVSDFDAMVGSASAFRTALAIAAKAARGTGRVLIEGETGTGKETLFRAMHAASPRAKALLRIVSVGGLTANGIESVLFGHEKGAFPGAFDRQIGALQHCDGATLVIDEVDRLPLPVQERLLEALQRADVRPIGARHSFRVDVRLITASNLPLRELAAEGAFLPELLEVIAPTKLVLPPLRERLGDIPALAYHFLARIGEQPGLCELGLTDGALALLAAYDWPGNVRQLQAVLFRAAVFCDRDALTAADFPQLSALLGSRRIAAVETLTPITSASSPGVMLYATDGHLRTLDEIEGDLIRLAIGLYSGRMTEVARRLGIGRSTLYRKLGELGIDKAA